MFTAMVPAQTLISRDHNKKLVKIIQALLTFEESAVFRKPIPHKALGWDDYKEIVKKPIDLNFVRRQYNEGKYKFVEEVLDQIQLVWENVFLYAKKDHQSFDMAFKMQKNYDQLLNDFLPEYHEKINRVAYMEQFQPKKPEKKGSTLAAQSRNRNKQQKMDIQPVKEQQKKIVELEAINSKKRQPLISKKSSSVSQLADSIPIPVQQVKRQTNRKVNESQSKVIEFRKPVGQVHSQIKPENRERRKQLSKEIIQLLEVKNQTLVPNKQIETQEKNDKSQMVLQVEQDQKPQRQNTIENATLNQAEIKIQSHVSKVQVADPIENQQSQQNQIPPILVTLNKNPSQEQINEITSMMNLLFQIQQFDTLSKVVRILTKYEKQQMVIDGQDVNFRMNEIHVSTYNKIKKELEMKFYQLETSQKVKDFTSLIAKHNIKRPSNDMNSIANQEQMIAQQDEHKPSEAHDQANPEYANVFALEQ